MEPLETNRFYIGDCTEAMGGFPDDSIDLTVTSPPYDGLRDYRGYRFDAERATRELLRVTKKGGGGGLGGGGPLPGRPVHDQLSAGGDVPRHRLLGA